MKKTFIPFMTMVLSIIMFVLVSCSPNLKNMDNGDINHNIYPYLEFELSPSSDSYIAYVVEGAKVTSVSIPGERHTPFGPMPVNVFKGFENPEDAENLSVVYIDKKVKEIAPEALLYAESLVKIVTTGIEDGQNWAKLPSRMYRECCHFHGWKIGETVYEGGSLIPLSSDNQEARPYFEVLVHHDAVEPTCTEDGNIEYWECPECGGLFTDSKAVNSVNSVSVPALGHLFPLVHFEAVEPTCQREGNVEYWRCDRCLELFGDDEALASISDPTLPIVDHRYDDGWFHNSNEHWHECIWCHCTLEKENHVYGEGMVILEPTETTKGTMLYRCTECGYERTEDIPELDHEYLEETIVPPTCTTEGYTEHKCIHCGEIVKDNYVPALGHDMTEVPYLAPTCTEPGRNRYYHCSRCNLDFRNESATDEMGEDEKFINPLGHDFPSVWRWDDSFDEDMHFRVCLREGCGTMETGVHAYDQKVTEGHIAEESTCQHPNRYYWSCVCGKAGNETFESGQVGEHKYTTYVPYDKNQHQSACEYCGVTKEGAFEPHEFEEHSDCLKCAKCGYELYNYQGGFGVVIIDKTPKGHIEEVSRTDTTVTLKFVNDKSKYPPDTVNWYVNEELVFSDSDPEGDGFSDFVVSTPYPMTYSVMCQFINSTGVSSDCVVITGGE